MKLEMRRGLTNKWLIVYADILNHYGQKKILCGINSWRDGRKIIRSLSAAEGR